MNARNKLNVAFVNGSFLLAAVAGAASGSALVFVVAMLLLLAVHLLTGNIRVNKSGR